LDTMDEMAGSHLDAGLVNAFRRKLPDILATKAHWDERELAAAQTR
ncbi:MAG: hypothetical protein JNJ60_19995, partial [Rhodocyclaceae bacterium]|nr:hypothetical protein [Rhodocyclaceae bacterium]